MDNRNFIKSIFGCTALVLLFASLGLTTVHAAPRDKTKTYENLYTRSPIEGSLFSNNAGLLNYQYMRMDAETTEGGKKVNLLHLTMSLSPNPDRNNRIPDFITTVITETGKAPNGGGILLYIDISDPSKYTNTFSGVAGAYKYYSSWGATSAGFANNNQNYINSTLTQGFGAGPIRKLKAHEVKNPNGTIKSRTFHLTVDVTDFLPLVGDPSKFGDTWGAWIHFFAFTGGAKITYGTGANAGRVIFPNGGSVFSSNGVYEGFQDIFDKTSITIPSENPCLEVKDTLSYPFSDLKDGDILNKRGVNKVDFKEFTVSAKIETGEDVTVAAVDTFLQLDTWAPLRTPWGEARGYPGIGSDKPKGPAICLTDLDADKDKNNNIDNQGYNIRSGTLTFNFKSPTVVKSITGINMGPSTINPNQPSIKGYNGSNLVYTYNIPALKGQDNLISANNTQTYHIQNINKAPVPAFTKMEIYFAKPGLVDDLVLCKACVKGEDGTRNDECKLCPGDPYYDEGKDDCNICPYQVGYKVPKDDCEICANHPSFEDYDKTKDECLICFNQPGYGTGKDKCGLCEGEDGYGLGFDDCGICPNQMYYEVGPVCDLCPGDPGFDPDSTCATPTPTPTATPEATPKPTPTPNCPPPGILICADQTYPPTGPMECVCIQPTPTPVTTPIASPTPSVTPVVTPTPVPTPECTPPSVLICVADAGPIPFGPSVCSCVDPTPTPTPTPICVPPQVMVCPPDDNPILLGLPCMCMDPTPTPCKPDICGRECGHPEYGGTCTAVCKDKLDPCGVCGGDGSTCCTTKDVYEILLARDGATHVIRNQGMTYVRRIKRQNAKKNILSRKKLKKLSSLASSLNQTQLDAWSSIWTIRQKQTTCDETAQGCVSVSNVGTLQTTEALSASMVDYVAKLYTLYKKVAPSRKKKRAKRPLNVAAAVHEASTELGKEIPANDNICR